MSFFLSNCYESVNFFVKLNEQSQTCLSYAIARKSLTLVNFFVKLNEQSQTCLSYAIGRKSLMKSNFFVKQNGQKAVNLTLPVVIKFENSE